jgi:hypothetical protein
MFANQLHQFLTPLIGHGVARKLILNYSSQVNKPPQQLTPEDLPDLGKYFAENVRIFVGADQAKRIAAVLGSMVSGATSS